MNILERYRHEQLQQITRRHFLRDCTTGMGAMWLASQGLASGAGKPAISRDADDPLAALSPSIAPKAKRVIFLHMVGAPSQLDLFDYKPELKRLNGQECPKEFLEGKRFAFIQGVPKMLGPQFAFNQYGECGAWVSDRLPSFRSTWTRCASSRRCRRTSSTTAPPS